MFWLTTEKRYAHDPASPNKTASGGYKDNGTPGDDAIILYIDKDTINTVELDVVTNSKGGTTHEVGLANIMAGREKGYDKTPLYYQIYWYDKLYRCKRT